MLILFKILSVKKRVPRSIPVIVLLLTASLSYSQAADSLNYFMQKGLLEKQNGRRLESLKQFEKAQKFDANNKALLTELASAYMDLRRYQQAIDTYKKLVDAGETTAANYKQLLTLSFNFRKQDDVLLYADKLKKADPSENVSYYIGKVHYDRENYGDAIKHLNEAAKEDPKNAEAPYMVARSYTDMQNYKQAIPFFQKAVELDTSKPHWIYEMGLVYYAMNDEKNALKYIKEAGDKGLKKDNSYLQNLGIAYMDAGNLEEGVAIMDEVLKRKPSDINVLDMVAEAYYYKGKYDQAIEYWDRILIYDKQNASALYMIGMSYQKRGKKGDKEKGQLLCDKAIEIDPSLSSLRTKKQMPGM